MGAFGQAPCNQCHSDGYGGAILHWLDPLRRLHLRQPEHRGRGVQQHSPEERVLRLPHLLVHPLLRTHLQLHLPYFLRLCSDQEVGLGEEIDPVVAKGGPPRQRNGQRHVR